MNRFFRKLEVIKYSLIFFKQTELSSLDYWPDLNSLGANRINHRYWENEAVGLGGEEAVGQHVWHFEATAIGEGQDLHGRRIKKASLLPLASEPSWSWGWTWRVWSGRRLVECWWKCICASRRVVNLRSFLWEESEEGKAGWRWIEDCQGMGPWSWICNWDEGWILCHTWEGSILKWIIG